MGHFLLLFREPRLQVQDGTRDPGVPYANHPVFGELETAIFWENPSSFLGDF